MTERSFENRDIEKLAAMVARGFEAVDNRFDHVESRIDTLETEMRDGFRSVNERIDKLQEIQIPLPEQDELWQRVRRCEDKLGLPDELKAA